MTILTHTGGSIGSAGDLSDGRDAAGTGAYPRRAIIKRFCMNALTVLTVGSVVAGLVALKAAIYLSRLNY